MPLPDDIHAAIARITSDRISGATALVLEAVALLRRASGEADVLLEVARTLPRAQPSMAGIRTACALAVASRQPDRDLEQLERRITRAPAAIARAAVPVLRLRRAASSPLRIVTCSRSAIVQQTLLALRRDEAVRVCCGEGQPAREGVGLARALHDAGLEVELYSDAGLSFAIPGADAVLVGADAVGPSGFINKVGTGALAALARSCGIPVVVLAGRERIVPAAVFGSLPLGEGSPAEILAPAPFAVRNPYFERVSKELASQLICDAGGVSMDEVIAASPWTTGMVERDMSLLLEGNMLDKH